MGLGQVKNEVRGLSNGIQVEHAAHARVAETSISVRSRVQLGCVGRSEGGGTWNELT